MVLVSENDVGLGFTTKSENGVGLGFAKRIARNMVLIGIVRRNLVRTRLHTRSRETCTYRRKALSNKKRVGVELRGLWRDIASIRQSNSPTSFPRTCNQHPQVRMQHNATSLLQRCIELPAAVIDGIWHSYFCALWRGGLGRL